MLQSMQFIKYVVDGIGVGSTVIVGAADFKNAGPDATTDL